MSDNASGSMSLGAALYGTSGPASAPVGPSAGSIDQGKAGASQAPPAQPTTGWPAQTVRDTPRAAPPSTRPGEPPAAGERSLAQAFYGKAEAAAGQPFDAAKIALPEGYSAEPALMSEFSGAAKELRLDQAGADRLVALHAKALQAQEAAADRQSAEWQEATKAHYGSNLSATMGQIRERVGNDRDGQEFLKLMSYSGLGNNVHVLRVLERLSRGY